MNPYIQHCVPNLVYLQIQLIASGLTHAGTRETSGSKPWVEFHINYSLWLIICGTPGLHDLSNSFPNLQPIPIPILLDKKCDTIYVTTRDAFFWGILTWSHYLIAPLYRILIIICFEMIYDIAIAPTYFWKLCWHPKGRLIWQIISDPKGGPGQWESKIKPDGTKFHHQTQSNFTNKQRSRQRQNKGRHNELNTKKSRFVLLQISQGLDTNVPHDDGFDGFCCNNRFRYQARS